MRLRAVPPVIAIWLIAFAWGGAFGASAGEALPVEIVPQLGHSSQVNSVAISPDGKTALSGSSDHTLKLWDLATGREIRAFQGHSGGIFSVAISPDGRTGLSGGDANELKLWDLATGREIREFKGHSFWILSVAIAPNGKTALSGGYEGTIRLWDLERGEELAGLFALPPGGPDSPEGEWLALTPKGFFAASRRALTGGYAKSRTEGQVAEAAVGRLHEATGRPVLTAAAPGKLAYEDYKGHGVFTYALIEALHQGDTNNNGKIEVSELAAHVERRVPELFAELKQAGFVVKGLAAARGVGGGGQTAHYGSTGEDFSLVAKLP